METWEIEAIMGSIRDYKTVVGSYDLAKKVSNRFPSSAIIGFKRIK